VKLVSKKPDWARYLPHGPGILLLQECTVEDAHHAHATTLLAETPLGAVMRFWPSLWGLEMLAQAAACLPVHGRIDGPRQGYLVKADKVRFAVGTLPADEQLTIRVERAGENAAGLNICDGVITRTSEPEAVLLQARFYLWNKAA